MALRFIAIVLRLLPLLLAGPSLLLGDLVVADKCGNQTSEQIDGNWYCKAVAGIQYTNVGTSGSYDRVTAMNEDGTCSSVPFYFSGPLAPLDEEVSVHFRGPIRLVQFAAYSLSAPATAKKVIRRTVEREDLYRHRHRLHRRSLLAAELLAGRGVVKATLSGNIISWVQDQAGSPSAIGYSADQEVTATINGVVVSWPNNWHGSTAAATTSTVIDTAYPSVPTTTAATSDLLDNPDEGLTSPTPLENIPAAEPSSTYQPGGSYDRISYYDSNSQTSDNLVFLGNHGGQGSGVFDYNFGSSLSYSNSVGTGGAASPQILADTVIPSDSEFLIMSGDECGYDDCGFVRPGAVAYHGFAGADKLFLIEFSMPHDGATGFEGDQPAIWLLNAQIPRTQQYGNLACSCWNTGCGEFDIAEALNSGSTYLKSTLHDRTPGGDSDYLLRPTESTMKLAIVFISSNSSIHIQELHDDMVFSTSLSVSDVHSLIETGKTNSVSDFQIST